MSKPSIGIGLPVYQNEKFLAAALDSILAQSYSNFVVYLSEDQSDDKTANICQQYAAKDPRIRYTQDRKSTRLNSSHITNSYAVCCLKKKSSILQRPGALTRIKPV